jgi:hypothetical protein
MMKFLGEIDTFRNTGPRTVPYVLSRSQYGTIVARHTSDDIQFLDRYWEAFHW